MKYLLLASMLGAANANWIDGDQFTAGGYNIIAINPANVDNGEFVCGDYHAIVASSPELEDSTAAKALCAAILAKHNSDFGLNLENRAEGQYWSPGGCWFEEYDNGKNNNAGTLGSSVSSIWWGSPIDQPKGTDGTQKAELVFCIGGDGDAGGGDGGGGADPCPEPKPSDPAEYINAQCCDCQ